MGNSVSVKNHVLISLRDTYGYDEVFNLKEVYNLCLNLNYDPEIYKDVVDEQSRIRSSLQDLEVEQLVKMFYYEDKKLAGYYCLVPPKSQNFKENIFNLEELKKLGRIHKAPGITFVEWAILNKNEVMSHKIARELNIPCQTRVGDALFLHTIDNIAEDIRTNGYDYRDFQPAVSELETPVEYEGNTYKWIVRDGNNRFELPWNYFPCAIISGDTEYSLLQYGAISNAPLPANKNDCTPEDVMYMIQKGFERGEIEKDLHAVVHHLKKHYPNVNKHRREKFALEILGAAGVKASFEPFDLKKSRDHLEKHFGLKVSTSVTNMAEDQYQFTMGWGRRVAMPTQWYYILSRMLKFPNIRLKMFSWLETGEGVSPKPNKDNAKQIRNEFENSYKDQIEFCCAVADAYRAGKLPGIDFLWLPQVNDSEKHNQLQ